MLTACVFAVRRVAASVVDTLITHPNVMNGASLYWPQQNMLYTEGYALDQFCAGNWGLLPLTHSGHRIGLLLDAGLSDELRLRHLQAADAARATLGINVAQCVLTEEVHSRLQFHDYDTLTCLCCTCHL
jgi:Protein of unknown function (DUF3326)